MSGLKTTFLTRKAILEAMKTPPPNGYFEWDGLDEEERPATPEEIRAGIEATRRSRGRPRGSNKEQVTIRFDKDVLAALKATGRGWQTRVNDIVREWVTQHAA